MEALDKMGRSLAGQVSVSLGDSLYRALQDDVLSRLPELPRETPLSLRDMFSSELWESLSVEQRRIVATRVHDMSGSVVHLMPTGRAPDITYSIHDRSSPTAELAKKAAWEWLLDDEVFHATRYQFAEILRRSRANDIGSDEALESSIDVLLMRRKRGISQV